MVPIVYLEIAVFVKARRPVSATTRMYERRTSGSTSTVVIVRRRRRLVSVIVISRDGRSFAEEARSKIEHLRVSFSFTVDPINPARGFQRWQPLPLVEIHVFVSVILERKRNHFYRMRSFPAFKLSSGLSQSICE